MRLYTAIDSRLVVVNTVSLVQLAFCTSLFRSCYLGDHREALRYDLIPGGLPYDRSGMLVGKFELKPLKETDLVGAGGLLHPPEDTTQVGIGPNYSCCSGGSVPEQASIERPAETEP